MSSYLNLSYKGSLSLLTDFYQITMAYSYWQSGLSENETVFHLYFRKNPFNGGYSIASGLEIVIDFLNSFKFTDEDISYLSSLNTNDGKKLFESNFLIYLKNLKFSCTLFAVPEGTVIFPNEPILRIQGPLLQCQLLETPLLNIINFHTLITTKAMRIVSAADGKPVYELGLRRAQGIDGALSASRAAYIGGCSGTSNTLAAKLFNIPVQGTHSHSWVMVFDNELDSFYSLAQTMPDNIILLVDTYNTIEGIKNAILVAKKLKLQGKNLVGIRLDSGNLTLLSIEARKLLDDSGFEKVKIIASNDLNEHIIANLNEQKVPISAWGVGTQLVTAFDEPALGGVYKLSAIKNSYGTWKYRIKLSEQAEKISNPGILQIRRFQNYSHYFADMIFDEINTSEIKNLIIYNDSNEIKSLNIPNEFEYTDLLIQIFKEGIQVYTTPTLNEIRKFAFSMQEKFKNNIKKIQKPHFFTVGLEKNLYDIKKNLIQKMKSNI